MNVSELVFKDSNLDIPRGAWACGVCGMIWHAKVFYQNLDERGPKEAAERCCNKACDDCGEPSEGVWVVCRDCRGAREAKVEAERFEKAKKVPLAEYDGEFLYIDGAHEEGYVPTCDAEDAIENIVADGRARPKYAWGCSSERASFDLSRAINEDALAEHHEDAAEWVDDDKLEQAQALINEAIKDVVSYHQEFKIAVLLPKPETP